jgi:hypothetical protein
MSAKLVPFINGESTLDNLINYMDRCIPGFFEITESGVDADVMTISSGSVVDVAGNLIYFEDETTATGSPTAGVTYVYVTTAGEAVYTTTEPTWNRLKIGWYDQISENVFVRYIFRFDYAVGATTNKLLMNSIYFESYI